MPDKASKATLMKWPNVPKMIWPGNGETFWVRSRPTTDAVSAPMLKQPGANLFKTQPDGMWININSRAKFTDIIAIEDCGSSQNLHDKRSRYFPASHSLVLEVKRKWINTALSIQGGGSQKRHTYFGYSKDVEEELLEFPIRFMRVLYALNKQTYDSWRKNHVPTGYEFYCTQKSLASYNSPKMQEFLRRMTYESHFYTNARKSI